MTDTIKSDQYYVDKANAFIDEEKYVDALRVFVNANTERPADMNLSMYMMEFMRKQTLNTEDALGCLMMFIETTERLLASITVRKYPNLIPMLIEQGKMDYVTTIAAWMKDMKSVVCDKETGISKNECYLCYMKKEVTCCSSCGQTMSNKKMKTCGQCIVTFYCDKDCQKSHWAEHKKVCKEVSFRLYVVKKAREDGVL